jgi:hypothetical protein
MVVICYKNVILLYENKNSGETMKNLIYLLVFIRCTQVGASAISKEAEEKEIVKNYRYHIDHYEVVLTDRGGMLKFNQLEELKLPMWTDMEIYELVHWGTKILEKLSELQVPLTKAQIKQIHQLEGIVQTRVNQLQMVVVSHNYQMNSAEAMSADCAKNSEKMKTLQENTDREIKQFFIGRKDKLPDGISTDSYEGLGAVLNSLDELSTAREAISDKYLSGQTSFKQYAEDQKRGKSEVSTLLSAATTLLDGLKKFIRTQNKR